MRLKGGILNEFKALMTSSICPSCVSEDYLQSFSLLLIISSFNDESSQYLLKTKSKKFAADTYFMARDCTNI